MLPLSLSSVNDGGEDVRSMLNDRNSRTITMDETSHRDSGCATASAAVAAAAA